MNRFVKLTAAAVAALGMIGAVAAQDMPYAGVTIDIVTFTGPQIAEPLQRHAPDFAAATGATVNVVTVPFADLYQSILTDQATGTNSYEGFVFAPQWMVDYVVPGYLADISDWVAASEELAWDDISPFFRDFSSTFNGRTYTIPFDGDFQMVYYRADVLEAAGLQPPRTWDEYVAVAEAINGVDMNGDGEGDYGSCIGKARAEQGYWFITSIAAGALQTQGTGQGGFFDNETFEPLINNAAFIRALELYQATNAFGPPDELNIGVGDTRSLFSAGRCGLTLDWGDIGALSVDPEQSQVRDLVGAVVSPGWTEVLDRATGELVACDETLCPYAIDGVNYAPFSAFGGWSGGVSAAADPVAQQATFDFFAYVSAPAQSNVDVTIGRTGFNPYRVSQFTDQSNWIANGYSEEFAANYLGAIEASLNSPNMMLDLRVPNNQRYQGVVLDEVLSQFLAGEYTAAEAAQVISDRWNEISDELGRDVQQAAYLSALGAE
ncbi:MAG: extracellular solute-binding protein [Pleurocapsa minor GSE-CHR-MK-17-07R]|jgi:multiple sugar transport system substrate-binding protein|nr:extracellular solute-binding protein [Pleurocapsa minor GSE-CHR-MK 17-07R]